MIATLCALVLSSTTLEFTPTDDLWVYSRASEPDKDPYLRVWGSEGLAVAPKGESAESFGYSYLRFDLSSAREATGKLVSATLVLTHVPDPAFTLEDVKGAPIEARALDVDFSEKTWTNEDIAKVFPKPDLASVYGSYTVTKLPEKGKPFAVEINLLQNKELFPMRWEAVRNGKPLNLALTSTIDPAGMKGIYKFYSKDAPEKELRPKLKLVFE